MQYQPTINIGMIGSVSNGKSSITEKLTGVKTQKYSSEQARNITIKLGYANAKIYKCTTCPRPSCYQSFSSNTFEAHCKLCNSIMILMRHVSFIDCPGHNHLLETMLNGTCLMDYTILVEAINNKNLPSPQSVEHLKATSILKIPNIITCINKVDLSTKDKVVNAAKILKNYMDNNNPCNQINTSPIVPVSANLSWNIDVLCEYICMFTKGPETEQKLEQDLKLESEPDLKLEPNLKNNIISKMVVVRSFNVNKPNTKFCDLVGGVIGGSILSGKFTVGDTVKLCPGLIFKDKTYLPLITTIKSIHSENNKLQEAVPGGLIAFGLDIDPSLTVNDNMTGQMIIGNDDDNIYKVYEYLGIKLKPIVGNTEYLNIKQGDKISINYSGNNITCTVDKIKDGIHMLLTLDKIICICNNDIVTVSKRRVGNENMTSIVYGTATLIKARCKLAQKHINVN